jgi:predicted alpha-1,2-mannosidase
MKCYTATSSGVWKQDKAYPGVAQVSGDHAKTGAWLDFDTRARQQIQLKIGISFVSIAQAKQNALRQIHGFNFDQVRANALKAWNDALAPIQVTGGTPDQLKMFFTSVYHTMLMPVDRTGDNPLWQSDEPYYDDFYTIWDTFRSSGPLLTLIAQDRQTQIIRALVDIYRHEHFLPDGRSGNFNGRTQGGSDADTLIADAFVKGLPGINWQDAYAAVVKDAEIAPDDQFKEGRGGLQDWKTLGYCSLEGVDRSGNKTMEYAYNDFGIALMAKGLGKRDDQAKYLTRAGQWQNLWDDGFADGGFSGFIRPRHRNGEWKTNFTALDGCSWNGDTFYEGNSWTYSFFAPQDVASLIRKCGGKEKFVQRLDAFFNVPGRCDVTDEPFFLTPYLYIWAGQQAKTAERVHHILTHDYHPTPGGLPGNDDSGAMGSWSAFGALGFFPNAGQDIYLIGTPMFSLARLTLGNGKTFTIRANNVSDKNIYIASARLNGKPFNTAWIRHAQIMAGGILDLQMADKPSDWPTGPVPPSPVSDGLKP